MKRMITLLAILAAASAAFAEDAAPPAAKQEGQPPGVRRAFLSFDEMDANKDGKLSLDEFQAAQAKMTDQRFARIDKNSDGVITKDEFPQFPQREGAAIRPSLIPDFAKLDKDSDGKVTKDELAAAGKDMVAERFKNLDKNGDGVVTKEEFEAGRPQFGGRRGGSRGEGQPPAPPAEGSKKPTI
jgi:hypothetical protein